MAQAVLDGIILEWQTAREIEPVARATQGSLHQYLFVPTTDLRKANPLRTERCEERRYKGRKWRP